LEVLTFLPLDFISHFAVPKKTKVSTRKKTSSIFPIPNSSPILLISKIAHTNCPRLRTEKLTANIIKMSKKVTLGCFTEFIVPVFGETGVFWYTKTMSLNKKLREKIVKYFNGKPEIAAVYLYGS